MSNFSTVLVKDATISEITSEIDYAVQSGPSQTTYQPFAATSQSSSSLLFSVQVPSENIVLGRDALISSTICFQLHISNVPPGQKAFDYGYTDSLTSFPLASLQNTATVQINNATASSNVQDIMPIISRMTSNRDLQSYNGMTPTLCDQFYYEYSDAVNSNANPMSSFNNMGYDSCLMPRGSFPIEYAVSHVFPGVTEPATDVTAANLTSTSLDDTWVISIKVKVSEPIFVSPFTWSDSSSDCAGLVGVNSISLNFNIDSSLKRLWSSANLQGSDSEGQYYCDLKPGYAADGVLFEDSSVKFKFLSTQPSDHIETKNVVPFMAYPRYVTAAFNNQTLASGAYADVYSNNLQINQIPDKFIVVARKPMSMQKVGDSNSFLKIDAVSINFNNQSGLLSGASAQDLWRLSKRNGSSQSWLEFSGKAYDNNSFNGDGSNLATTGSILVLNPSLDMSLPDMFTCGSLGNFNLQMKVTVTNQTDEAIPFEICIIAVNSGVFVTEQGTSSMFSGILTREAVLSAKQTKAVSSADTTRMIGGSRVSSGDVAKLAMKMGKQKVSDKLEGGSFTGSSMGVHASGGGGLSGLY